MYKIIITKDGSNTIYNHKVDEHYHSINGAVQESEHVFINAGFKKIKKPEFSVLEIGFGTGLNALLSLKESRELKKKIRYTAIELFPLEIEQVQDLNFTDLKWETIAFNKLHSCVWNTWVDISDQFSILKIKDDIIDVKLLDRYDLIYFDAFSPSKQPELWSEQIFRKISNACNEEAVFTTYSAKGSVRRMLQKVGFSVQRIPGPTGKREMLRGIK